MKTKDHLLVGKMFGVEGLEEKYKPWLVNIPIGMYVATKNAEASIGNL
jgi:hypothetical protein